jgi:hypothetical protein
MIPNHIQYLGLITNFDNKPFKLPGNQTYAVCNKLGEICTFLDKFDILHVALGKMSYTMVGHLVQHVIHNMLYT